MKKTPILLIVLPAIARAQSHALPGDPLIRLPNEITAEQAMGHAQAFLRSIGEPPLHSGCRDDLTYANTIKWQRVYDINDGSWSLRVDAATGRIDLYALSSYEFLHPRNPRAFGLAVAPSRVQAESLVERTARVVGLPVGATRTRFVVEDRNPHPDADARGYIATTYVGKDRSQLHMAFDRRTGRLEMLIRIRPLARKTVPHPVLRR